MTTLFYISAGVALVSTLLAVTRTHAVHALLYLAVSLLSAAVIFFLLGAPFAAALEVIIYAGAIMVLFIFVVMLLNVGVVAGEVGRRGLRPGPWIGPSILALLLVLEVGWILVRGGNGREAGGAIGPAEVGRALVGPYAIGLEAASMLLLGALVGALHLGRRDGAR